MDSFIVLFIINSIIVGAGAAGLMAAAHSGEKGRKILCEISEVEDDICETL